MIELQSKINISKIILSYGNWDQPNEFEKTILSKIVDEKEIKVFKKIWATANEFNNWNYKELNIGIIKTINVLSKKYNLDKNVCEQLANAAAYQWK